MKEEIGYTVTGRGGGKMADALRKTLLMYHNPIVMGIIEHPEYDTLIINEEDWNGMDLDISAYVMRYVTVKPTKVIDKGNAFLFSAKENERQIKEWLTGPFEPFE